MSPADATVPQDIELILDAAEPEAPGLRDLARRFLGAQATHRVSAGRAGVLARRAEGVPEVHIAGVADELVKHLVVQPDAFDGSALMTLAYTGAIAMAAKVEPGSRAHDDGMSTRGAR